MRNKLFYFVLFLMLVMLVSGCNQLSNLTGKANLSPELKAASPASMPTDGTGMLELSEDISPSGSLKEQEPNPGAGIERKIIYQSGLKLEVKDVPSAIEKITSLAKLTKGFVLSSYISKGENQTKYGEVVVRVPPENLDKTIAGVKQLGDLREESMSGDDISKDYYDLESRLKNSQYFEERLIKLLGTRTSKVQDLLEVEKELSRVRADIEQMQGTKRYYDNMVNLSTLRITLYEKGAVIPRKGNLLQPIINTFGEAFNALLVSIGAIFIILFALSPWLILLAVLAWIGIFVRNKIKR